MFHAKVVEKAQTHFTFNNFFSPKNGVSYKIMGKIRKNQTGQKGTAVGNILEIDSRANRTHCRISLVAPYTFMF
jgi:hypothetical protein